MFVTIDIAAYEYKHFASPTYETRQEDYKQKNSFHEHDFEPLFYQQTPRESSLATNRQFFLWIDFFRDFHYYFLNMSVQEHHDRFQMIAASVNIEIN